MFKKLLRKVIHSIEESKSEYGHRRYSSSDRGRRGRAEYYSSHHRERSYSHSSSSRPMFKRGSSSDYRHHGGHKGHKFYKNRNGSHSS